MITRKPHIIGKPFPLVEAQSKLTGVSCYAGDEPFGPDLLHARILFSKRAHARVRLRGVEQARRLEGVAAVLTGREVNARLGAHIEDRTLLAVDEVTYAGQPLAVVAAESPEIAMAALATIQVDYDDLPAVFDVEAALAADAPLVHPDMTAYPGFDQVQAQPERNIAHRVLLQRGDVDAALADAAFVLERTYTAAPLQHAPMETHGGVAQQRERELMLWLHVQAPFLQRQVIARALHIPPQDLRIITQCVGGSFGSKVFVSVEALLAAIARETHGRPVRLHLTREEEFQAIFMTPAMRARVTMGLDDQGRIIAMRAVYDWNVGASVDAFILEMQRIALAGTGPYAIPNTDIQVNAIYTHLLPAAPMRSLSIAQMHWAIEQHVDELAEMAGMSPLLLRQRNLVKGGDQLFSNFIMHANGLESCVLETVRAIGWQPERDQDPSGPVVRGKGLAMGWSPIIVSPHCKSRVTIQCDGDELCSVIVDGVDVGQGYYAFITQLIAFELNLPIEWITVHPTDTGNHEPDWQAIYHNLLWSTGRALLQAVAEMKRQILSYVSEMWEEPMSNLDIVEGEVISYATRRRLSILTLLQEGAGEGEPPVFRATGVYEASEQDDRLENILQSYAATGYAAEVAVNLETGHLTVLQLAGAADVGHAINPEGVKAQLKGGIIQSISLTLLEEMQFENGVPISIDFMSYPIATTADMPQKLHPIVVEIPQSTGPYGARDLSNHVMVGASAAIGNAIYQATGVRIRDLPITAQRLYDALRADS